MRRGGDDGRIGHRGGLPRRSRRGGNRRASPRPDRTAASPTGPSSAASRTWGYCVVPEGSRIEDRPRRSPFERRQGQQRTPPDPGRGMPERLYFPPRRRRPRARARSRARGSRRRSGRWRRRSVLDELDQRARRPPSPLDQQPLGMQPPEQVVIAQRSDQPGAGRSSVRSSSASRPSRRSGRCGRASCRAGGSRRRSPCRSGSRGRRVVLDDVVVPVDHPDVAVGTDLGHDRARSTRRRWRQVAAVVATKSLPRRFERERGDEVPGRLGDERDAVPVLPRIGAGRVERMAGRRGEAAVPVDLADFSVAGRSGWSRRCSPAPARDQPRTAS